jgi:hypothetical protein
MMDPGSYVPSVTNPVTPAVTAAADAPSGKNWKSRLADWPASELVLIANSTNTEAERFVAKAKNVMRKSLFI